MTRANLIHTYWKLRSYRGSSRWAELVNIQTKKKIPSNYSSDTIFDARELWQANSHLSFPFITPTLEDLKAETMWFLSVVLL